LRKAAGNVHYLEQGGPMIRHKLTTCLLFAIAVCWPAGSAAAAAQRGVSERGRARIAREVRHELAMLPYYTVFDHLAFEVNGATVTLLGQVTRPTLKSDAQNVVKGIEGVEAVTNKIEVLPLSPADDRIRRAVYHAIYGDVGLDRYALAAVPSIHILVKNGQVTLEGVVDRTADKDLANLRANGVSGVFSVTNHLTVQKP
jgi:hyperosmotically inducible protein